MACQAPTFYLHTNEYGIAIAIAACGNEAESIARGLPLCPQFLSRSAKECDITTRQRTCEGFLIHESDHEHFAVAIALHYGRNQAAQFIEVNFAIHFVSPKSKKPAALDASAG